MEAHKTGKESAQNLLAPNISISNTHNEYGVQQFKYILFFLFILGLNNFQNKVCAQNGDSCNTAISIPLQEGYSVSQSTYKKWYSFYANDTIATFSIGSEANLLPDSIIIYVGNCDSLIQYGAYLIDTERVKLVNVPFNQSYYVCFISTARNCGSCLISPLNYHFSMVDGDAKSIRNNGCINPGSDCEYICNGSFEFRSNCPTQSGQFYLANSWTNVIESPEYFNLCQGNCSNPLASNNQTPTCVSIPINFAGNQDASPNSNGNTAYSGLIAAGSGDGTFGTTTSISYAEYIGQQLDQPLLVGVTYTFSVDISWAEVSKYKAKDFGVYFSNGVVPNPALFLAYQPQIIFDFFIDNSTGWTTLTATFTPTVPDLNTFYFGIFPNWTFPNPYSSIIVPATPLHQTSLPDGLGTSRWAYYYVDNFSMKIAETEKHFDVSVCPTWTVLGIFEPEAANLVIPNFYTNIDWDATTGLTINPVAIGQETFTATYIGAVPATITAHAYLGNCPIDLFFHIDFEDLCSCNAFNCPPGLPPAQNNSSSTNACFYPTNTSVFQYITGVVTQVYPVVEFSNSFLKMGPYASIVVANGKTLILNSTTLFACSIMWTGIVVEAGGTLIINDSRIEDALKAIEVQLGANVIVNGCNFNKNWIGVSIESGAGSAEFVGQNMTFSCSNTDSPTAGNLLLIPHLNEHGFTGIYAYESPHLNIGNMAFGGNLFTDIQYGIYAEKSSIEIVNCNFQKLFYNGADPNSNTGIYTKECDLVVGGLNTSYLYNRFSKLRYGIKVDYYPGSPVQHVLLINSNQFENYSSSNTPFERCIFVIGGQINTFEIADNIFEGFKMGISIFGSGIYGEIKYNRLEGRSLSSAIMFVSSAAIRVSNPLDSKLKIFENRINANQDHICSTGIDLLGTSSTGDLNAEVAQNLIYNCRIGLNCMGFKASKLIIRDHDPSLGAGIYLTQKPLFQYGIRLLSCVKANVYNNYVKANSGSAIPNSIIEKKVIGILVGGNCSVTRITENYFWRLGTGMSFAGGYTNNPVFVTCNRMIQNVNGVNISNTDIGDQGYAASAGSYGAVQDNQWSIPTGSAYMGAKVSIPFGQIYPTWFTRSASLPFLPNQNLKMFPQQCIIANLAQYLVPNADYNCGFGCPNPPCQHFRIYEMAFNQSPYDEMSEEELGNVKLALLYQLKNDTSLLDSLLNVGGMITNYISNLLLSEENELANSAKLLSKRDTVAGIAALSGVNTNTDPRSNQVIVNEIFARTWARGLEVTLPQDSVILAKIACTEPQYGGLAVFDAMAMINWDTCFYSNFNNERLENSTKVTIATESNELLNSFKIYPNPTESNLIVEFYNKIEINSIIVTDISGSQISCNFDRKDNQILIEAINLAKGFYIVKLIGNQNIVINAPFIKK